MTSTVTRTGLVFMRSAQAGAPFGRDAVVPTQVEEAYRLAIRTADPRTASASGISIARLIAELNAGSDDLAAIQVEGPHSCVSCRDFAVAFVNDEPRCGRHLDGGLARPLITTLPTLTAVDGQQTYRFVPHLLTEQTGLDGIRRFGAAAIAAAGDAATTAGNESACPSGSVLSVRLLRQLNFPLLQGVSVESRCGYVLAPEEVCGRPVVALVTALNSHGYRCAEHDGLIHPGLRGESRRSRSYAGVG